MDKKIHDLRLYLGLSQKNFGEAIGYTGFHIFRIEQKAVNPSERFIQKVCEVFHVGSAYFTGEMSVDRAVQKAEVDTAGARLAEALEVGVDWLLTGDEEKKQHPVDKKLVDWLWEYPEVREELWKQMKGGNTTPEQN